MAVTPSIAYNVTAEAIYSDLSSPRSTSALVQPINVTPYQEINTRIRFWVFVIIIYISSLTLRYSLLSKGFPKGRLKEPVPLASEIPLIGHLLGFYKHGAGYFNVLRTKTRLPIFTIKIFSFPIYVITCPKLASLVQRSNKTLTFNPVIATVSRNVLKFDEEDMKKITESGGAITGHSAFLKDLNSVHHKILSTGPSLNRLRNVLLGEIAQFINQTALDSSTETNLYAWVRHVQTFSTALAVWGPMHPFINEPNLAVDLWTMEKNLSKLLANIMPEYTAHAAVQARQRLNCALSKYYENGGSGHENFPDFVKAKKDLADKHGLSSNYNPRADVGELMAMLINVVPTSFWMLLYIFSSPSLLADLRTELSGILSIQDIYDSATKVATHHGHIDLVHIKQTCPLLHATWLEVLRLNSAVTTNRVVLVDTIFNGNTPLKAGGIVQIPASVFHSDPAIWGPDAEEFNPRRFLVSSDATRYNRHPAAFRPFGGGSTLCPGRHLAETEILGLTALVVLGFEIVPNGERKPGVLEVPRMETRCLPGAMKPIEDVEVVIERRRGFEGFKWEFKKFSRPATSDVSNA